MSRKILIPYKDVDGRPYSSSVVSGGIEMFIRNLDRQFDDVEVVEIVGKDYERSIFEDLVAKINLEKPDLIVCNYPNPFFNVFLSERVSTPIAWVCHHTAGLAKDWQAASNRMKIHVERPGNTLWMVSKYQQRTWGELPVAGIVRPSFVERRMKPVNWTYYAATVGRCEPAKDPFRLHRICAPKELSSVVMTNSPGDTKYWRENLNWRFPQDTFWNIPHQEVMSILARAGSFVSTWSGETFGITVLEALSLGVPAILLGDRELGHASEALLTSSHSGSVVYTDEDAQLEIPILISLSERRIVADSAWENFGVEKWKTDMRMFFERAASCEILSSAR